MCAMELGRGLVKYGNKFDGLGGRERGSAVKQDEVRQRLTWRRVGRRQPVWTWVWWCPAGCGGAGGKEPPASAGDIRDVGSTPGAVRQHGSPVQCACLEGALDRGAWWATDHAVARSGT